VALGVVLILASGGTIAAMKLLTQRYERSITRQELVAPEARQEPPPSVPESTVKGPLNYLLLGSDYRTGNPNDGQRADSIIVVHVPATLDRAYLISIPRDLRVTIPPYKPKGFGGDVTKINAAYQYGGGGRGGAQLLSATVSQLMGIKFNGAAIINFDGFRHAVDVLGGVYMCVDHTVASNHLGVDRNGRILELYADEEGRIQNVPPGGGPYVFQQGCRRMDGRLALDYARIRYGLPAGDYDRQRHQQQFLKAVMQEATGDGVITNPLKFDEFLRAVGAALTVDTGEMGLADLLFGLRGVTPSSFVGIKMPSHPEMIDEISYVLPDQAAPALFRAIQKDTLEAWTAANPNWVNQL
jgi:LCP family protein required for cell wall assembly